jgi:type I site-specific restriction endonuclease
MTPESEWQTRKQRIDPKLESQGWTIAPFDPARPLPWYQNCAIEEYPTENGPADYALCVDGRLLGIVEASQAVEQALSQQKRQMLLAMAAGTGKPSPCSTRSTGS